MTRYGNGQIPLRDLHVFETGSNSVDGAWYHALSPATYAKHRRLCALAFRRTKRKLSAGDGFSTYRPMHAQVKAREIYGNGAAVPGTSSHGGSWEGRDTLAIDYSNWEWVYETAFGFPDWAAFQYDCYAAGLSPGLIMPDRGYPAEQWHVIDLEPWGPVPEFPPLPNEITTEDIMAGPRYVRNNQTGTGVVLDVAAGPYFVRSPEEAQVASDLHQGIDLDSNWFDHAVQLCYNMHDQFVRSLTPGLPSDE